MPRPAPFAMPRSLLALRQSAPLPFAALLAGAVALLLALAAAPARAGLFTGDPVVGPTPALHDLQGIDLAPDGSGAIAYLMDDGGVQHVFVSRLVNGVWSGPERLDADLGSAATQAAVAVGDSGRVLVVFANGGNIYAATRADAGSGWGRQTLWSGGASDPAVDLSVNGKGYAAFTAPGAGGHDVRGAYARDAGPWTVIGAPLDANAGNDAGAGTARPRLAASADGVAITVWGEAGHVFARRLQGVRPSVVAVDALDGLTLEGLQAGAADLPVVSTQDDDSFGGVAVRAAFDMGGGVTRMRAVFRRLRGSRFETPVSVEPAPLGSGQDSSAPHIATVGTGQGLVVAGNLTTNATSALQLLFDVEPSPPPLLPIDSLVANSAPGFAVPAAATARKMVVAWQVTPPAGVPEIHARYRDGGDFEAEQAISRGELGPTDAANGLLAAADDAGDVAVAYVQGVPGQGAAIAVATVDQPPGRFAVRRVTGFQRTDRPTLSWTTSRETWGRYFRVVIDGVEAGITGRRSFRPSAPLAQGAHTWQVIALDHRGQQYAARPSSVKIDTVPAFVQARVSGPRKAEATLRLAVQTTDTPTGTARKAAGVLTSGVGQVLVSWGDRTPSQLIRRGAQHVYARAGRYTVRVLVTDRAGNRSTFRVSLKLAKPARRARRKHAR